MSPAHDIRFGPFRLDPPEGRLWQHDTPVPLTPKAFAVLHQLARQPGRRLDKDELLSAVWGERHVSDAVLKVAVREIRKALGDEARDPSYIETVHRHGYRFIAELSRPASSPDTAATLVGRRAELELLRNYRDRAFIGQRQVVFVTGEPGLGKTTLIDSFLAQQHDRLTASGHALEQFGGGEPYLPMLEALGRLSRGSHGNEVVDLLHRYAPTWLLQLPALLDPDARLELQHETRGATPERMLREMAEALEALTAVHPLILVLEDLQWSDYSTLDLIVRLARRPESARLLLLATFRPEEARRHDHPLHMLIRDLEPQPHCHNLRLDYLSTDAVANYLHARGPAPPTDRLAATIRAHTGGNPLFMTAVIDYLASQQRLVHERDRWRLRDQGGLGVPESIRQLIERQIDRLDDQDQQLLYTASVAGNEMSAIAIAHALSITLDEVEDRCDRLVNRRQFLRHAGVRKLPDRTITARYAFIHALHQHVLYERLSASRRSRLHRRIGHGGEATYGDRASDIAPELAHHFARAGDPGRAIHHLEHAAKLAARRHAAREAIGHLDHALKLANDLTDVEPACERLLLDRGLARRAIGDTKGAAVDFDAAAQSAHRRGETETEVRALLYLVSVLYWLDRDRCLATLDLATERSAALLDTDFRAYATGYCAHWNLNLRGWRDRDAADFRHTLEQLGDDPVQRGIHLVRDVYLRCWQSDYQGADRVGQQALASDAFDDLVASYFRVWALLHAGRWRTVPTLLDQASRIAEKNGHHVWTLIFRTELAWLHLLKGDPATATELCRPAIAHARAELSGQLFYKSLVVQGHAHLVAGKADDARTCFQEIIEAKDQVSIDRILDLPLHHGTAQAALALGDLEGAENEAAKLRDIATPPGERTYMALADIIDVEIAMARDDLDGARERLEAIDLEQEGIPLAARRGWTVAVELYEKLSAAEQAEHARRKLENLAQRLRS